VFSTLQGLLFNWSYVSKHIKILSLQDASYKLSDLQKKIEEDHLQSDSVAIRGILTGKEEVHVKFNDGMVIKSSNRKRNKLNKRA
jgi:hypothetical protein